MHPYFQASKEKHVGSVNWGSEDSIETVGSLESIHVILGIEGIVNHISAMHVVGLILVTGKLGFSIGKFLSVCNSSRVPF